MKTTRLRLTYAALVWLGACQESPPELELGKHEQEFRTALGHGHDQITHDGLGFLPERVRETIADANEDVDGPLQCDETSVIDWFVPDCGETKLSSAFHVDNCRFRETFDSLRQRYVALVETLHPETGDFERGKKRFGTILHTMQDFFAHSNWVDSGRSGLLAEGGLLPPSLKAGELLDDMVVLAKPLPAHLYVTRDFESRVPRVWDGERMRDGLISGTYDDNEDEPICPSPASIPHGDFVRPAGDYLAKDSPDALYHDDAIDVATEQTREEFCRLARLVIMRHGFAGRARLLDAWQANEQRYAAACPNDTGIVTALFTTVL